MDFCSDVVLEVSAGVGGQEAMLFSQELLDMYGNYAYFRGWEYNIVSLERTEIGVLKIEASLLLQVFSRIIFMIHV